MILAILVRALMAGMLDIGCELAPPEPAVPELVVFAVWPLGKRQGDAHRGCATRRRVCGVHDGDLRVRIAARHSESELALILSLCPQNAQPSASTGYASAFGRTVAVDGIDLEIPAGSFYGLLGPNGAGKTTTLSMATGLLTPDAGVVTVNGVDLWKNPTVAKPMLGVLPDGLRTFDRLTGSELISYAGILRGLDPDVVRERRDDLLAALDLAAAGGTLVTDFSAGMAKKIGLACALVHAPRVLVLDEPFEAVDPVSATGIRNILQSFVASGGTVVISSHVMALVERLCDRVAIIGAGRVLAEGTLDEVRGDGDLEARFVALVGDTSEQRDLTWLQQS